jgi:quercetin dioxygenase-like cupin family protein
MRMRFEKVLWGAIGSLFVFCLMMEATPGAGYVFNYFNRSTSVTDAIHQEAHLQRWNVEIEVEGATDFVQQDLAIGPGGFSGWHSHPGPVLITVKSGTATWYSAENPTCAAIVYPAGSAFIEPAGVNHFVANQGTTNLELLDTYLVPKGMPTRQEQPQPSHCPF